MSQSRIDSISYSSAPARKKPQAGDIRIIGGVEHIRQQRIINDPLHGRCHLVSNGRPVWEWVVKGGDRDRRAPKVAELSAVTPEDEAKMMAFFLPESPRVPATPGPPGPLRLRAGEAVRARSQQYTLEVIAKAERRAAQTRRPWAVIQRNGLLVAVPLAESNRVDALEVVNP